MGARIFSGMIIPAFVAHLLTKDRGRAVDPQEAASEGLIGARSISLTG